MYKNKFDAYKIKMFLDTNITLDGRLLTDLPWREVDADGSLMDAGRAPIVIREGGPLVELAPARREMFEQRYFVVDIELLRVPRQPRMMVFEYREPGASFSRARMIHAIYESATLVPRFMPNSLSEKFLQSRKILVHDDIGEGLLIVIE